MWWEPSTGVAPGAPGKKLGVPRLGYSGLVCALVIVACATEGRRYDDKPQPNSSEGGAPALPSGSAGEGQAGEGIATPPNCGDGKLDADEDCDDGSRNSDERAGACNHVCRVNLCNAGETRACASARGNCAQGTQRCQLGQWSACSVAPAANDSCSSGDDANCNGIINEGCDCLTGTRKSCAADGAKGNCAKGFRTCDGSGHYGACDVTPRPADSCDTIGDDADCDGVPNSGCPCQETDAPRSCGPATELGACRRGTSHCANGSWSACEGAVFPTQRNCASSDDLDCDGEPDNTIDSVCKCAVGSSLACDTHPGLDGEGPCQAGKRSCIAAADGTSADYGTCGGSIGPQTTDSCQIAGDDANCDGVPNGSCDCVAGAVSTCGDIHQSTGDCAARQLRCSQTGHWPAADACAAGTGENCSGRPTCAPAVWDAASALFDNSCWQ